MVETNIVSTSQKNQHVLLSQDILAEIFVDTTYVVGKPFVHFVAEDLNNRVLPSARYCFAWCETPIGNTPGDSL